MKFSLSEKLKVFSFKRGFQKAKGQAAVAVSGSGSHRDTTPSAKLVV